MSDVESAAQPADVYAQIEANYTRLRDFITTMDSDMIASKHFLHSLAVYVTEDGDIDPDPGKLETAMAASLVSLEMRILNVERILSKHGMFSHEVGDILG